MTRMFIGLLPALLCLHSAHATENGEQHERPDTTAHPTYHFDDIIIEDSREGGATGAERTTTSTEGALTALGGVTMIRRADIALEPSIRGMSAGQITVMIDGMRMSGACVDRMDPVTAYVEQENLQRIALSKGATDLGTAQTIGGTLTLHTTRPEFDSPFALRLKSGTGSGASLLRLYGEADWSTRVIAVRAAAALRRAGNYEAGGSAVIHGSGYEKENYKLDLGLRPTSGHTIFLTTIVDNARDIGFPALVMDTRSAQSLLAGVTSTWTGISPLLPRVSFRAYTSTVRHLMDDNDRSEEEVRTRVIMPGMRMPMTGRTQTTGVTGEGLFAWQSSWLNITAEAYQLDAFADMSMHSLEQGVPSMYLVNIAGARLRTVGAAAEYYRELSSVLHWRASLRADYSHRTLRDTEGRRALLASSPGMPAGIRYTAFGVSTAVEYTVTTGTVLGLSAAQVQRLPTHIENYGFYLYSPMDNAIYLGNTLLRPETARQMELTVSHADSGWAARTTLFGTAIDNYIAGRTVTEGDTTNTQFPQAFRRYDHIGRAFIAGVEADAALRLSSRVSLRATVAWQHGFAPDIDDNLPFMPPLHGSIRGIWSTASFGRMEVWSRFAAPQHTVSSAILGEDTTPGYAVVDLRWTLDIARWCTVDAGVENVFDTRYHEHASINNLPAPGRNVYATLELRY